MHLSHHVTNYLLEGAESGVVSRVDDELKSRKIELKIVLTLLVLKKRPGKVDHPLILTAA